MPTETTTIFEELRADHDRQRDLMRRLSETTGDEPRRRSLFATLKEQLTAHADAEEHHFYTVLMTADATREKARHSVAEHHEMDELIEKLEGYEYSASAWLTTFGDLEEKVLHHLEEEEREVFPLAGRIMSDDDKSSSALGYRKAMDEQLTS